jgi:hypothetical protein
MKQMENMGLIRKIAWSFHSTTGLDFDELCSEMIVYYYEGLKLYNPKRGKLTTFMWWWLDGWMKIYIKKCADQNMPSIEDLDIDTPDPSTPFLELLSEEAQQIAKIVLCTSKAFVCLTPTEAEARVAAILTRRPGWTPQKIQRGITELKAACREDPRARRELKRLPKCEEF